MNDALYPAEQLANEWASRICSRLETIGVSPDEVRETRLIILTFTRIAAEELSSNPRIKLNAIGPYLKLSPTQIHQTIDLFLRGVNHSAKKLRDAGLDWKTRREHLENLAWKLLNLAKLLVGLFHYPNPPLSKPIQDEHELQQMMKQHVNTLFKEQVSGIKNPSHFMNNFSTSPHPNPPPQGGRGLQSL